MPPGDEGMPFETRSLMLDRVKLVLVMGCPRSGTTFLLRSLSGLPRSQAFSGFLISDRMCHVLGSEIAVEARQEILYALRSVLWRRFVLGVTSRRYHFRNVIGHPRGATEDFRVLAGRKEIDLAIHTFIYKEPFMTASAEILARHFIKARFIHIIRDGRDCADSLQRSYGAALSDSVLEMKRGLWWQMGSEIGVARQYDSFMVPWWVAFGDEEDFLSASKLERYLWMWSDCVRRGRGCADVAGERYLEVRYEDLCLNPDRTGRTIMEFLGVQRAPGLRKELSKARSSSIGIARSSLGGRDEVLHSRAHDLLGELGYL